MPHQQRVITEILYNLSARLQALEAAQQSGCLTDEERVSLLEAAQHETPVQAVTRFSEDEYVLTTGKPIDATRGIEGWMCVDHEQFHVRLSKGVQGMEEEVEDFAKRDPDNGKEIKELLHYIVHERTSEKQYPNGVRDKGRGSVGLSYFLTHPYAHLAQLLPAEVVALRLYTTAAYRQMNNPLRDTGRQSSGTPCPLPVCTQFAEDGVKKLRAVHVSSMNSLPTLWRGMRNMRVSDDFKAEGGTELAFMSTTTDPDVAIRYSLSGKSLIFKIVPGTFMSFGAELQWLSAFPGEAEILFPPLTYLKPTGREDLITASRPEGQVTFKVVELAPYID